MNPIHQRQGSNSGILTQRAQRTPRISVSIFAWRTWREKFFCLSRDSQLGKIALQDGLRSRLADELFILEMRQ